MGSTDTGYKVPTKNVAVRHFNKSDFAQALTEFRQLYGGASDLDVLVMHAICEFRLGDIDAIANLRSYDRHKLTSEHESLLLRHEVLGHLCAKPQRLDEAMKLLSQSVNAEGHRDLGKLWSILRALREGQQSAKVSRHPHYGKGGLQTPVSVRTDYLRDAAKACKQVSDKYAPVDEDQSSLIGVVSDYMLLRIELRMSSDIRDKSTIRLLRQRLSAVDKGVKESLPSWIFTRLAQYQRSF